MSGASAWRTQYAGAMRGVSVLVAALACAGCGLGTFFEGPEFVDYAPAPPDKTRLYVYRPEWHGVTTDLTVDIDGTILADLNGATYVSVLVEPRKSPRSYTVRAEFDAFMANHEPAMDRIKARPGHTVFCAYAEELSPFTGVPTGQRWLACSEDPAEHEALKHCRQAALDADGGWDP